MSDTFDRLKAALADHYTIERELGAGGMATVYLAHDQKHDREVAVKVMRPELSAVLGGERFLREVAIAAKLNHPHILALYDSGEAEGFLYYVMPHVDGESLRSKLNRERQLSVDEAIAITRHVGAALDYAHDQGVIHRDVKPENILIHQGEALVADFGIALAVSAAGGTRITDTGLSLGTPEYMSPEQATGERELDARSDVYSLGAITYEMLVGEPPHTGNTVQAIIAKVVSAAPQPVSRVRHLVPNNVDAAVLSALGKSPADRFVSGAEFTDALMNPTFALPSAADTVASPQRPGPWKRLTVFAFSLVALLALTTFRAWSRPTERPVSRYHVALPTSETLVPTWGQSLALSPDGAYLAYIGPSAQGQAIWLKARDELHARRLAGTDGASQVFFDPSGENVGFLVDGPDGNAIMRISLSGGPPMTVTDSGALSGGASWGSDGYIYVSEDGRRLLRVPQAGGVPTAVSSLVEGEFFHILPHALASGRGVLFTVMRTFQDFSDAEIAVSDPSTGEHRILLGGAAAWYAETGHLVFVRSDGTLFAVPFDDEELMLEGTPIPILGGIAVSPSGSGALGMVDVDISANGTLVYVAGSAGAASGSVVWVDRYGTSRLIDPDWTVPFESVSLSPDGTRLAVNSGGVEQSEVWIKQLDRGPASLLTFRDGLNRRPAWTHDGSSVTFISAREGNRDLYVKRADGAGSAEAVLDLSVDVDEGCWSADGEWLIYRTGTSPGKRDIFAFRPGPDSMTVTIAANPDFDEFAPVLSPDGRWVAYVSSETGREEVWVRPFPDSDAGRWQVSVQGGAEPVWAHSGRELFYKSQERLMAVGVQTSPTFATLETQELFSTRGYFPFPLYRSYDVTADDQQFVMIRIGATEEVGDLIVVENFFEVLKERVGN